MEAEVKAKKFGWSIGVIIQKAIVERERINVDDTIKIEIEKKDDLGFLWERGRILKNQRIK